MALRSLQYTLDANLDGSVSVWEIWEAAKFLYRLPGNLAVEGMGNIPMLADALRIQASPATGYESLGGTLSLAISLAAWVALLFWLLTVTSPSVPAQTASEESASPGGSHENISATQAMATQHNAHSQEAAQHGSLPGGTDTTATHHRRQRAHLPVSRRYYAAPGTRTTHRRHRPPRFTHFA